MKEIKFELTEEQYLILLKISKVSGFKPEEVVQLYILNIINNEIERGQVC